MHRFKFDSSLNSWSYFVFVVLLIVNDRVTALSLLKYYREIYPGQQQKKTVVKSNTILKVLKNFKGI
jgi:hypothetical protein